jgi:hypothetical protein
MKPKTRLQVEVWNLHNRLSKPIEHEPFVISKHDFYFTTHYKNLICLECNHMWKPETETKKKVSNVVCPSCKKKVKKLAIHNGQFIRILSYSVVQVVDRFQVVRYFSCWKIMEKNKKPRYNFRSLFEEWTEYDKNKKVIIGKNTTWSGDGFSSSDYEVRYNNPRYGQSEYDRFTSDFNCPGATFLPRFKKYGLGKDFHNCDYRYLLNRLERSSKVETLFKSKQKELLFYAVHKNECYHSFWPQIKILLRHKYKIKDAGMWYDYLELLKGFGKDILNPKFILPENLKKAHNEYVAKEQIRIDKERAEREIKRQENERLRAEAETALKNIKADVFKDFSFKKGKILIVPLIEEKDVKEEGKVLKHCVHTNGYHNKSGILLMSARIDGQRIETIEISLASYSIIQCRGFDNNPTEYHDEIIQIVRQNMGKISRLIEKQKKLKEIDSNLNKLQGVAA